jgi:hypothetical protein
MTTKKLLVVSLLLLSGCASEANFRNMLTTWQGQHVDNLVSAWGPPASSYPLSSGGRVLEYKFWQSGSIPITVPTTQETYHTGNMQTQGWGIGSNYSSNYSGTSTTYGNQTTYYNYYNYCNILITTNDLGYMEQFRYQGNDCKM